MESTGEEFSDLSPMELLPTEILQKIMACLPIPDRVRVERVCKRWKNASTEAIWKDVQTVIIEPRSHKEVEYINTGNYSKLIAIEDNKLSIDILSHAVIESLVSRVGQHVKEVILDCQDQTVDFMNVNIVLSIIAVYCRNIEIIQLSHGEDLDIIIRSMLLKMNKKLHSIAWIGTDDVIDILPLKDWKSLYLGRPFDADPTDNERDQWEKKVATLIDHSPSLENLYVYDSGPLIITAISKCKNLKNLLFPMNDGIATNNLSIDTTLLNRLTCLSIQGVKHKDYLIINLLRHCINLESLGLHYIRRKIPIRVLHAVSNLPKLESLELECFFTRGIMNHLGKFKHLILTDCPGFTIEPLIIEFIRNSEDLETLDVSLSVKLIEKLVENTRNRREILKLHVRSDSIYKKALEICRDSRIHVFHEFKDLMNDMRLWIPRNPWDNQWESFSD